MSAIATEFSPLVEGCPTQEPGDAAKRGRPDFESLATDALQPNVLVRWAFYLSLVSIPFALLSLPGTGGRITVIRLLQMLILCAILSQPRVCIRFVPSALFWFLAYCAVRIVAGFWLAPEQATVWWPSTLILLQFALPWVWVMFNVLQFPNMSRRGLWALVWGCVFCALFHIAGIGMVEVDQGVEGRSTVFGENANGAGATYAVALIVLVGLGMFRDLRLMQRLLLFPLVALVGTGLAKTGSRSSVLILAMGVAVLIFQGRAFGSTTKRIALLLAIGIILAGVVWRIPTVIERFQKVRSPAELQQQEGRVRMAPVLWEMFLRSPIYGSGPDEYRFELTRRSMPYHFRDQRLISAHNLVLMLLVETGIIGFLLFACGVRLALVGAWRARLRACGSLPLAVILPLIMAGTTVSQPGFQLVFWFAMAYALAGSSSIPRHV